jgi:hypothetical protein
MNENLIVLAREIIRHSTNPELREEAKEILNSKYGKLAKQDRCIFCDEVYSGDHCHNTH